MSDISDDEDEDRYFKPRPYQITGGRTKVDVPDLALETLLKVTAQGTSAAPRLALERKKIASLCVTPISVAEVSAHLSVPLGVAKVLVGDMIIEGFLSYFQPQYAQAGAGSDRPDLKLLERVLDGLQAL